MSRLLSQLRSIGACSVLMAGVCVAQQPTQPPTWFNQVQFFSDWPASFDLPDSDVAAATAAPFTAQPWGLIPSLNDEGPEKQEVNAWHALGRLYMPHIELDTAVGFPLPNAAADQCVDVYGNPVIVGAGNNLPAYSVSNSDFQAYMQEQVRQAIDDGGDGFHFDNVTFGPNGVSSGNNTAGCFDSASMAAFRGYLGGKYSASDLNSRFGITAPATFDYGQWIRQQGTQKTWNQHPLAGLAFEFYLFQFAAEKSFLSQMQTFIHQYALQTYGRTATLSVNTNFGFYSHPYFDVVDYFVNESYTFSNEGLPPFANADIKSYKAVRQWPVATTPEPGILGFTGTLPTTSTNMIRLAIADIYASGGTISFAREFNQWSLPNAIAIDPSVLKTYAQFILATPALFENLQFSPQVAILDSTDSRMAAVYALAPTAGLSSSQPSDAHYYGTARLLIDGNTQYDSVLAPDTTLSTIPSFTLAQLQKYKVLVLADTLVLNDDQANTILGYVNGGGVVIATGLIGTYEPGGQLASRSVLQQLQSVQGSTSYGSGLFIHTSQNLGAQYQTADMAGNGAAKAALLQTFQSLISPYITPDVVTSPVSQVYRAGGATAFLYRNPANAFILHLVNYDYDPFSDTYGPKSNVQITLRVGSQPFDEVILRSPDMAGAQSLAFTRSGDTVTFTVPYLLAWDVLYLQQNALAPVIVSSTPAQSSGATGGSTLNFNVQAQDPDGNPLTYTWTVNGQVVAGLFGSQFSYPLASSASGTYIVTVTITDGSRITETSWTVNVAAYRAPRFLFDETHSEQNTLSAARAQQLSPQNPTWVLFSILGQALAPEYQVTDLLNGTAGSLTPQVLSGTDVLVLAAPNTPLTAAENQAVTNFVQSGGGLIFLGDAYIGTSINTLIGPWGIQFSNTQIESPNDISGFPDLFDLASFANNPAVGPNPSFEVNGGGSLTISQGGVALGQTSAGEWKSVSGVATQQPGDPNGPFVMVGAAQFGSGRVFVVSDNYFVDAELQYSAGAGNLNLFLSGLAWVASSVNATPPAPPASTALARSVVNSGSFAPAISPGSWATVFGSNLANTSPAGQSWSASNFQGNLLPTGLSGTSVLINGRSAAVSFVSPGQLNVQAPDDTTQGTVAVQVITPSGIAHQTAMLTPVAPSIFPVTVGGVNYAAAVAADGTLLAAPGQIAGARAANPGETILIFGTGFGDTVPHQPAGQLVNPSPLANTVTATICGQPASVAYGGLVEAGLNQFNVVVPASASGNCSVQFMVTGQSTQSGIVLPVAN